MRKEAEYNILGGLLVVAGLLYIFALLSEKSFTEDIIIPLIFILVGICLTTKIRKKLNKIWDSINMIYINPVYKRIELFFNNLFKLIGYLFLFGLIIISILFSFWIVFKLLGMFLRFLLHF